MLDQLNLELTASNVRAWTIDVYWRKTTAIKQIFDSKKVSDKVDLRTRRKRYFIEMNLLAVVGGNLRVITAAVDKLATAGAIRKHIARCFAKLGILEKKIYKLMKNYGSNVLKVGRS